MVLRFAPIIRVSTEGQEKKGESLRTQMNQIKQYVKSLDGEIPEYCWGYMGQEHATPNQERKKLDRLLEDSGKDLFDAVIVCDASRWSRDNLKNKKGLEILRRNGIRFFVGTMEYDLYNPEHTFFLGMSAEIGEFQAKQQSLKSIISKIERAKRGVPITTLPYGRTYEEGKGWGIDEEKVAKIRDAARRYLNGESIVEIAASLGMNHANLWKVLNHRSGPKWEIHFDSERLHVKETVEIEVPPLLDEATIRAIKERGEANRTYAHGEIKHRYLLSRMIFCSKCGCTLFGQASKGGKRYYRHARPKYSRKDCRLKCFIPAELIENSVLIQLIRTFGDKEKIRKAVERATPNMDKLEQLSEEKSRMEKEKKKITAQKNKVVDMVAEGMLTKEEVKEKIGKLRERESQVKNRLLSIDAEMEAFPDPGNMKRFSELSVAILTDATANNPRILFKRPYEWKRNLLEYAFGGKDFKGQRLGVYVMETNNPDQPWEIEVRGILETTCLALPLDNDYLEEAFHLDPEYQDLRMELEKIRSDITSFTNCSSRTRQPPLPSMSRQTPMLPRIS